MSKLYLVPTPIGNLGDITIRALDILKSANMILAEDTRTTRHLLDHYQIKGTLTSHHKFNEHRSVEQITDRILSGENIVLVSDAGTPSISDPGFLLVRSCVEKGVPIECLPGATALIPALACSGLASDRFTFEGFLPLKKGRQTRLKELAEESRTMIFYESPHRLLRSLEDFIQYFGAERRACVARELTKMYEEIQRGSLTELLQLYKSRNIRGEIVIVVEGKEKRKKSKDDDIDDDVNI